MGYLDDYLSREGKCEYCKFNRSIGSPKCAECYGSLFEDNISLYEFIRNKVTNEATDKFNQSEKGKLLLAEIYKCKKAYDSAKQHYEQEKKLSIDYELKRIDNAINSI